MSSTSDEEDNYLGTKKFGKLQAQFNNFYQNRKIADSDEEELESYHKSPTSPTKKSNFGRTCITKNITNNTQTLNASSDDEPISNSIPSTSFARAEPSSSTNNNKIISLNIDENDTSNKDPDDVLKRLDKLAESAKELSEDFNAAICGKKRKNKKAIVAAPVFFNANKDGKRTTRNSARLSRLKTQLQLLDSFTNDIVPFQSLQLLGSFTNDIVPPESNKQIVNTHSNNTISLTDSDSDHECATALKRLKENPKLPLNPTVQININWRCDSEITHTIAVFKFQCLSCIEDFCCKNYNIDPKLILFTIEDKPVSLKEHCYASLRLTETSVIDGGVLPETYLQIERPKVSKEAGLMKLKVQYVENSKTKDFPVHVKRDDTFEIVYWLIIKELHCEFDNISLNYDGDVVKILDKVDSMGLEEDDCLDLILNSS